MSVLLGCIADDFTGATDLANTLTRCGMTSVVLPGVPGADFAVPDADAIVVALKSRSNPPADAVRMSLEARDWLARAGARIGLIARGRDGLEAARREVEALGGAALVLPLDVADAEAVEHAAGLVEERLGPIGIWINNAMVSVFSPIAAMRWEAISSACILSRFCCCSSILRAAWRTMAKREIYTSRPPAAAAKSTTTRASRICS